MKQQTIIISIAILIVIVAGMFGFAYLKKAELTNTQVATTTPVQTSSSTDKYASITSITAKHYFINGVHTFAGEILMPTPCDLVESTSTVSSTDPNFVTLNFTVINNSQVCEQVQTNQRFKVSAAGNASTSFSANFMGRGIKLNLIPAQANEKPEDFQLYQKG